MFIFPLFQGLGWFRHAPQRYPTWILWAYSILVYITHFIRTAPCTTCRPLRPMTSRISSASSVILNHFATGFEQKILSLGILAHQTSDDELGVYNHLRKARYLGSITNFSFGDWVARALHPWKLCNGWNQKIPPLEKEQRIPVYENKTGYRGCSR